METQENTTGYLQDNIFVQLGLGNLSEESKAELLEQMNDLVEKRLTARLLEEASEEQRAAINAAANGTEEELFATLLAVSPDFPQYLQEEIDAVKEEMRATMQ